MDKVKVISISVAAGLILAGIIGFIVYIEVVNTGVTMSVSSVDVTVGEIVNFTAEGGSDDLSFRWEFGDGTNATGRKVQHFYRSIGSFNATLFVDDKLGWKALETETVTVSDLVFHVPFPWDGDAATYNVVGTLNMSNPQGLFNTQVGEHNVSLILVKLSLEGPLEAVWNVTDAYDEYGNLHDALALRHQLDSVVGGKTYVRSEVGTTISDIAGDLWLNATEVIDLDTNGTLSTNLVGVFDSSQGILGASGIIDENATLFRDQRIVSLLALAQSGIYGRDYSMSMPSYSIPGVITWEFVGPEAVNGLASYRLRGTTPLAEDADINVWVSPSLHKLPRVVITLHSAGNATIDMDIDATMVSESRGAKPIAYGECRQNLAYHLLPSRGGLETAPQVQKRLLPADGTNESWFGRFNPRKAIDYAKANNQTVADFMLDNDDTFAQSATFAVMPDGSRVWTVELLTSQNATALSFSVVNTTGVLSVKDVAVTDVAEATQRPAARTVVTFAQAERLLADDPSLARLFNGTAPSQWVMTYVKNFDMGLGGATAFASLLTGLPSGEIFLFSRTNGTAYVLIDADDGAVLLIDESATSVSIMG